MDVKLRGDKPLKIKLESDEMAVRIGKQSLPSSTTSSNAKLKANFEESITLLRNFQKPTFPLLPSKVDDTVLVPECPSLNDQHPILKTLLKLIWETHENKYMSIVTTFQEATKMKVENTKRIRQFTEQLQTSQDTLLKELHENELQKIKEEFRSLWANEIQVVQSVLKTDSTDIDELLDQLIQRTSKEFRLDPSLLEPTVDKCLSLFRQDLLEKSDTLWKQWTLQLERHTAVLKGKLEDVRKLDEKLLQHQQSKSKEFTSEKQESIQNAEYAYREMILTLSSVKLDFEIRTSALQKLKAFLSLKLLTSKQEAIARLVTETLQKEENELEKSKVKLQKHLEENQLTYDRILRELTTACNNSLVPVENILKTMSLTIDLNLETARERIYVHSLLQLQKLV